MARVLRPRLVYIISEGILTWKPESYWARRKYNILLSYLSRYTFLRRWLVKALRQHGPPPQDPPAWWSLIACLSTREPVTNCPFTGISIAFFFYITLASLTIACYHGPSRILSFHLGPLNWLSRHHGTFNPPIMVQLFIFPSPMAPQALDPPPWCPTTILFSP